MPRLSPSDPFALQPLTDAKALRTLNAFAVDLIAIPSVEDLFWYVARRVVGQLNFVDCVIYQANEAQTELTQVAALGEKNPYGRNIINPLKIPFGQGITGKVAQNQKAIVVDDLLKDQNYIPDTQPARSEICVPLIYRGRVVGVIDSEHPEPGAFGETELEILTTVAAMTSAKLELLAEAERSSRRYKDLVQSHAQLTHETDARKALETKLFEARKLEAIGRLTGKFAHDFNNLLTVILGNIEFLEIDVMDPESLASLQAAQSAAARGATLIRNMLAFSQRMRLEPETIDLNKLAAVTLERCKQDLTTPIELHLANNLWPVQIDPRAAETALLNLVMNAKEAMPEGGSLHIATENISYNLSDRLPLATELQPGAYVRLSIKDHGVGISADRLQQIFDPFYTTKAVGAGTGLSLSMVLGFMQQSGGAVGVTSKAQRGSTFQLYFPASPDSANDLLTTNP